MRDNGSHDRMTFGMGLYKVLEAVKAPRSAKRADCALSICLLIFAAGCTRGSLMPAAGSEVLVTGNEQAIVDAIAKRSQDRPPEQFANSLDHAFAVLLARASPQPEPCRLAQSAIDSLCEESQRQTGNRIPSTQRETWVSSVLANNTFEDVLRDLRGRGPEIQDRDRLEEAGLQGMLGATGWGAACVLTNDQAAEIKRMMALRETHKEPGVVGVDVDRWPVANVIPGMPAAKAGLQDGDVILTVDGEDMSHIKRASEGVQFLRGTAGEKLTLTVKRDEQTLSFQIRRTSAAAATIRAKLVDPHVVYVRIPTFEGSGIAETVKEIIKQHVLGGASFCVLDLRDNRGGRPEEANAVADMFLDNEYLEAFEFRDHKRIVFTSKPGAMEVGVILLTNRNTGSAAEMLALALRYNKRATIIGEPTAGDLFGKDVEELGDGRLIVFRSEPTILSPDGNDYSEIGVPPDIMVDGAKASDKDEILRRAIQYARSQTR